MTIALVPLRDPGQGKTRLGEVLPPEGRAALAAAMATDVIQALRAAGLAEIVLAAGGPGAERLGIALDVEVLRDPADADDLDAALAAAVSRVGDERDVLIVAADLPRLRREEVDEVLRTDAAVVVAPTQEGGTGGLLRRPAAVIPTAYGPGSARRHLGLAAAAGAHAAEVNQPGFQADTDTAADLRRLGGRDPGELGSPLGLHTTRWLDRWADSTGRSPTPGSHHVVG